MFFPRLVLLLFQDHSDYQNKMKIILVEFEDELLERSSTIFYRKRKFLCIRNFFKDTKKLINFREISLWFCHLKGKSNILVVKLGRKTSLFILSLFYRTSLLCFSISSFSRGKINQVDCLVVVTRSTEIRSRLHAWGEIFVSQHLFLFFSSTMIMIQLRNKSQTKILDDVEILVNSENHLVNLIFCLRLLMMRMTPMALQQYDPVNIVILTKSFHQHRHGPYFYLPCVLTDLLSFFISPRWWCLTYLRMFCNISTSSFDCSNRACARWRDWSTLKFAFSRPLTMAVCDPILLNASVNIFCKIFS